MQTEPSAGFPAKLATDPPVSEQQRKAMWAAAEGNSTLGIPKKVGEEFVGKDEEPRRAAGVALMAPDGDCLFVRRGATGDHAGTWAFPGGFVEGDEDPTSTAIRELTEELGFLLDPHRIRGYDQQVNGTDYVTFAADVDEKFCPTLNDENLGYMWAKPSGDIFPLHPGVKATMDSDNWKHAIEAQLEMPNVVGKLAPTNINGVKPAQDAALAFDRATARSYDADDRMHVATTNISKSNVCPYLGKEINDVMKNEPGWRPLQDDRIYQLLRDPEELRKAAATFNNLPLLSQHKPVSADNHEPGLVIGSTGTDAEFSHPYLKNSLVVWAKDAIDAIESEVQKELSSAYRYRAEMTPGNYMGADYDGVMRDIVGNHVALVREGRAGNDVVVGDSLENITLHKEKTMKVKLSAKAAQAQGALMVYLRPKLAQDAKLPDLAAVLADITAKNYVEKKPTIIEGLKKSLGGIKLAKDASLEDMHQLLDSLDKEHAGADDEEPDPTQATVDEDLDDKDKKSAFDEEQTNGLKGFLKDKLSEDQMKAFDAYLAGDDPPAFAGQPVKEESRAMDEKTVKTLVDTEVKKATQVATDAAIKSQRDLREAEKAVRPYVGELAVAFDSAEQVYRKALEILGVKGADTVHASALPLLLSTQTVPGSKKEPVTSVAMDAAAIDGFNKRYPGAARIGSL